MTDYARESGHSVRTQGYVFLVSFVLGLLVARHLGPHGRGALALAQQLFTFSILAGSIGLGASVRYRIARASSGREQMLASAGMHLAIAVVLSIALYGLGFLVLGRGLLSPVSRTTAWLFAAIVPLNVGSVYLTALLYGDGDVRAFNRIQSLAVTIRLVLIVGFVWAGLSVERVVLATLMVEIAALGYAARAARRRIGSIGRRPSGRGLSGTLRYGALSMLSAVLQWMNYRLDIFLVAALADVAEVGRYSVAVALAEILLKTSAALARPLFPRIARERLDPARTAATTRANVVAMVVFGACVVPLAVLAGFYLGPSFGGMLGAFLWLLPGTLAYGAAVVIHTDLMARGRVGLFAVTNVASLAINVALNVIWIPRHGIVGAAWATSVAYAANALFSAMVFRHLHGIGPIGLFVPRLGDLAAIRARARAFTRGLTEF